MDTSAARTLVRDRATPTAGRLVVALLLWEAVGSYLYFKYTPATPHHLRYLVYPFLWIDAAVLAVATTRTGITTTRARLTALAVSVPYTLALLYVPGVLQYPIPGINALPAAQPTVHVLWAAPGWGPLVTVTTSWFVANLVPFKLAGYLTLGYLAYATVLRTARAAIPGVVGLVTCVSCTAPLFSAFAGLLGGGAATIATATKYSVDLGTLAFLVSVAVLYYGANAPLSDP